jgi:hypothetical protein
LGPHLFTLLGYCCIQCYNLVKNEVKIEDNVTRFCHTHSYARALCGRENCVYLALLHWCFICGRSAELCIVILLIQFSHRILQVSLIPPLLLLHLIERRKSQSKRIPSIFNDESTGSFICLGCILLTRDMYMCRLRHK